MKLIDNGNYYYAIGNDLRQDSSSGKWKLSNDTLVLTSRLNRYDIPVTFKTEYSSADSLTIGWVKDLSGNLIKGAWIHLNSEPNDSCMPVFDECIFLKGYVKRIQLSLGDNVSTRWVEWADTLASRMYPVIGVDYPLDNYIFLDKKKYLLRKEGIYELVESIRVENGVEIKSITWKNSVLLKKVK